MFHWRFLTGFVRCPAVSPRRAGFGTWSRHGQQILLHEGLRHRQPRWTPRREQAAAAAPLHASSLTTT